MTQIDEKKLGEFSDGEVVTSHFFNECPFCGETTIYLTTGKDGCMNCPSCLVRMPNECNDHIELVHYWNTRAPRTISREELGIASSEMKAAHDRWWQGIENARSEDEMDYALKAALATLNIEVEK